MTAAMDPPAPKNPDSSTEPEPKTLMDESSISSSSTTTTTTTMRNPMGPPPPKNPNPSMPQQEQPQSDSVIANVEEPTDKSLDDSTPEQSEKQTLVPYTIPQWSGPPGHHFYLEVLKDGLIIDQFDVCNKGAYMFGRVDLCDFVLEHPTISRFHAVLQFKRSGDAYLYDLGSTHGTFINKNQVKKRVFVDLHVGDVIRFGQSSRLYIFQGPTDLMPPETALKTIKDAKIREQMLDREASLRRARQEASLADGISWGMGEDAIEEAEDDDDEVTWQTYKGQLTEKQEKTRDKVIKRTEKIAHMKKEIDSIRAKDIAQGGLTQGQQTQIARNEQRITQIMEELENLEETLNESIRESLGARTGKIARGKKKGATEDDEEFSSDDEFYDRTKKPSTQKAGENQSIETADTLLDKRDAIMKEMEDKKELLLIENGMTSETAVETEAGDSLDAYMSGLSSKLVLDKTMQLQKELSGLQSELDRIFYLLKIADPTGDAAKKRDSNVQELKPNKSETPITAVKKQPPMEPKKRSGSGKPANVSVQKEGAADASHAIVESSKKSEVDKVVSDAVEGKSAVYAAVKPQWLGAVENRETKEIQQEAEPLNTLEPHHFIDYKDRKKILDNADDTVVKVDSEIESAAPGLIIRKRKQVEKPEDSDNKPPEQLASFSVGAELVAEDAVALLLKHERGYYAEDDEGKYENPEISGGKQSSKDNKKLKRVLGPEKPSFLDSKSDYEPWVPPKGQSGDGRTSLNDRYGY